MRRYFSFFFLLGILAAFVAGAAACQDTPQPLPVRTMERAQRMDLVCMRIYDDARQAIPPEPAELARCASAASYNPRALTETKR